MMELGGVTGITPLYLSHHFHAEWRDISPSIRCRVGCYLPLWPRQLLLPPPSVLCSTRISIIRTSLRGSLTVKHRMFANVWSANDAVSEPNEFVATSTYKKEKE